MPKRTKHPGLRTHVRRGKAGQCWVSYSFERRGEKSIALGTDYAEAVRKYAEIRAGKKNTRGLIKEAFDRWEAEELPTKRPETRADYAKYLRHVRVAFDGAAWGNVTMKTLKDYLKARSAKTQGNRELSLLSIVWRWAQTEGLTDLPWPAAGLAKSRWKNKENARQVEYTDAMFDAVYAAADPLLRDYLDLASATGLRVKDVIALRLSDVRNEQLVATAIKTGKGLALDIANSVVLDVLARRPTVPHLFLLAEGKRPITARQVADRFKKARVVAAQTVPECATLILRDCRKRAAQLSDDPTRLLQHGSRAVTEKHYQPRSKAKAAR